MPALSDDQFKGWKANPNQMALPGLEEHGHPGAVHLAQGYHYHLMRADSGVHMLGVSKHGSEDPVMGTNPDGVLDWNTRQRTVSNPGAHKQGEITWVNTADHLQGKGLASSLYGIARQMAPVKPQHSKTRSESGDVFAAKSAARYGGPVPKSKRQEEKEALDRKVVRYGLE